MLVGLRASNSESSLNCSCTEYNSYARQMSEELEMTKRTLKTEYSQEEEASTDRQNGSTTSHTTEEASKTSKAAHEQKREIAFYKALGATFYSLGHCMTSIWYYEKAANMAKANGDKLEEQRIYSSLAIVLNAFGQFDEAISALEKALQLSRDIGDLEGELECYNNLGSLYNTRGQYKLAINCFSKGLDGSDRMAAAMAHNNIGNVYHASGQYPEAIYHHKESLEIRLEIDDAKGGSIAYNNLSCDYYLLGQYEKALVYQEDALEICKALRSKKQQAVCYSNLGCLYQAVGKHHLSLQNHFKGLKIRQEIGDRMGECRSYKEISRVHDALDHFRISMKYHEEGLKLERVISSKQENVVKPARHGQWISHQERGLEIIDDIGVRDGERLMLYRMALSHTSRLDIFKASLHLAERIRNHEYTRLPLSDEDKLPLDEQSVPLYQTLGLMFISFEHYTDAFLALEQGRARALLDLVSRKYAIQEVASQNFENLSGITSFLATQRENVLFMANLMDSICLWFIDRLGNLRFKSYFVSKDVLRDSLLNFVCSGTRGSEQTEDFSQVGQVLSLKQEADNLAVLDEFLQFMTYPCDDVQRSNVPFLHKVIFGLVSELPDDEEIIFVPEGSMFQLPFPALQNAYGDYLVEKVRVRLVPSITTLKVIKDSPADYHSTTGALLVGDPDNPWLARLPGARKEVEMIAALLGDRESCLIGSNATKQEVLRRIQNVSLVHFSAHGKMSTGEVALAGDKSSNKEDWLLHMEDVANVRVRAKLVVLSTCHGGQGKMMTAEGIVGIARAFLGCGARSVLVALWAIDDEATLAFMTSFYKFLLVNKMSASRSLQQAMKEMRCSKDYHQVRHWAPFVLYGDDVTLDLNEIRG